MEKTAQNTVFIIEHMETYLYEWCLCQYKAMKDYLQGFEVHLWITNAAVIFDYHGEKEEENKQYLKDLETYFAQNKEKYQLIKESVKDLLPKLEGNICMLDMRG